MNFHARNSPRSSREPCRGWGVCCRAAASSRLALARLLFAVVICDLGRDQIGTAPARRGGGAAGRRTWRPSSLGMPTARTCALQTGKSGWELSACLEVAGGGTRTSRVFAFRLGLFRWDIVISQSISGAWGLRSSPPSGGERGERQCQRTVGIVLRPGGFFRSINLRSCRRSQISALDQIAKFLGAEAG